MTKLLDSDSPGQKRPDTTTPSFATVEMNRCGLRLTRAEFARLLGCSKQTVSEWVSSGKVLLGADGRLDPRQAVAQILRNSNPARLRARILAPLAQNIGALQRRVAELEAEIARWREEAEFHEGASMELAGQLNALHCRLGEEREVLAVQSGEKIIDIILGWLYAGGIEDDEVAALENFTAADIEGDAVAANLHIPDVELSDEAFKAGLAELNRLCEEQPAENRRPGIKP